MKSKQFLQLIIFCFWSVAAIPAQAAFVSAQEAETWAKDKGNLLLETFQVNDLGVKYKKLDELFLKHVDLDYIGRFVIGKHWRDMNAEQQMRYQKLFGRYALGVYKSFPLTFKEKITYEILRSEVNKDYTNVFAQINLGKNFDDPALEKIMVSFRLSKKGNAILIQDIKLAESSLILSYRNRFYQMVAEADGDMEWFLEDFETTVQSTEETNRQRLAAEGQQ